MKAVTLRNLPPELARSILERARQQQTSANKAVIGLLEERLGRRGKKEPSPYQDLDELAGSWSKQEAKAFDKALARQRVIDPTRWP